MVSVEIRKGFALADHPWNAPDIAVPAEALAVPTMLSDEEARLLYWLCRDKLTGAGAICDLGCFLGGSTARMAAGLAEAGHADAGNGARIFAFDRFTLQDRQKEKFLYPLGIAPFAGDDMLPIARSFLARWSDLISFHRGDITAHQWTSGPIEVLFVDAGKTPAATDALSEIFMPSLIAGQSWLVAQDYQHWRQPWIIAQMELLSDCFEMVGWCDRGTVLFRCTAPVTPDRLAAARTAPLDDQGMIGLLRRALARFPDRAQRVKVARAIMAIQDNPGIRVPPQMSKDGFSQARVKAILAQP